MMQVYICSPYAGDIEQNIRFARAACRYAVEQGCAPVAVFCVPADFERHRPLPAGGRHPDGTAGAGIM